MNRHPADKFNTPFGNSGAIQDPETISALTSFEYSKYLNDSTIHYEFCKQYTAWISNTTNNKFVDLDKFPFAVYTNGTTEAFDKFYIKHHNKRFRCFKGEYMYHQLTWRNNWPNWCFIEDDDLLLGDVVVISLPFSDTGEQHEHMKKVLDFCDIMDIPVLVDCAYFGICGDLTFDFSHPCIKEITFSLSKQFPLSYARIGMRLTRTDDDDPLFVNNRNGYVNRIGCALGLHFISQFDSDYIVNKYKQQQLTLCTKLGVHPSKTVIFGIGDDAWSAYNRGRDTNRLSLHKFLHLDAELCPTQPK